MDKFFNSLIHNILILIFANFIIFTLNSCATVAGTNDLAQYAVNKVIPNVFKKTKLLG